MLRTKLDSRKFFFESRLEEFYYAFHEEERKFLNISSREKEEECCWQNLVASDQAGVKLIKVSFKFRIRGEGEGWWSVLIERLKKGWDTAVRSER